MNNIFKYIASFVALLSGLAVYAQNLPSGVYLEENGVAYAKRAVINNDGTYTIDLETFVTGEVTQTYEAVPVDVVLVLDVSGSMDETLYSEAPSDLNLNYSQNQGLTNYYYKYNDNFYPVYVGREWRSNTYYYYLYFYYNYSVWYIRKDGSARNSDYYNSPTYCRNATQNLLEDTQIQLYYNGGTKIAALKTAVQAFIDEIAHNDWYEDDTDNHRRSQALGNQISIVKFAMNRYYNSNADYDDDSAPTTVGDHNYYYNQNVPNANYTEVIADFTGTDTEAKVTSLKNAVNGLHAAGATAADYGMNLARILVNNLGDDRSNSNKTVVFFTDGDPTHGNTYEATVANHAIANSQSIKNITYGSGDDATHPVVYSVGVFSGNVSGNINTFMTNIATDADHYIKASGGSADNLKDIFTDIAHSSGGSGNTQVTGGATLTVDVVSSSFSVPKGFQQNPENAVEVLVAPCTGKTTIGNKEYLTFGEAKTPTAYDLPAITPSIVEADNTVSTTGFNYSDNWCGYDQSANKYHGYKQIIRFVITVNDDAVGGPAVETNTSGSGIYLPGSDKPLVEFNIPTVKLPVQIWIQKVGLMQGDNAVFTLARTPFVENFDPATAQWDENWGTKIVIGPEDLVDPVNGVYLKKQVGLNPDYYYRIKEDAWAFGYTYQYGGIQYTFGDNIQNPFEFTNTPNNKKYDEASVRNVFKEKTATSTNE